jgi:hypothetical protein
MTPVTGGVTPVTVKVVDAVSPVALADTVYVPVIASPGRVKVEL